jgi:hypothetical protein
VALIVLAGCGGAAKPAAPTTTDRVSTSTTQATTTTSTTTSTTTARLTTTALSAATTAPAASPTAEPFYANCTAVRAAGKAPLHRGDPGYRAALDRDGDGIACE